MSDQHPKIITTFQDRLALDHELRNLGQTADPAALRRQASDIVEAHGEKVIAPLMALLDTANPQLRGGLGYVAAALDPAAIVPALTAAAYNHRLPDQARLSAITILERFLGIEPDEAMYVGMAAPEALALESLHEVLAEAETDRLILLEYFRQLSQEPDDVLLAMVRATQSLEGTQSVELLRMFAQDPLVAASREALNILGTVPEAEAAQALQTLTATLPPRQSSLAERMVQKLRLRGVPVPAPPPVPAQGRCLASPIDGQDNQVLWFLVPASDQHGFQGLQILLDGQAGIREAVGTDEVLEEDLPPASPLGKLHNAGTGLQQPIWLEAPFDYGRRRALVALARNWETHRETPLAYRLFNPLLWRWAEPEPEPDPPQPQPVPRDLAGQLLQHPAMAGWFLQSRQIYEAAQRVLLGSDPAEPATVEHLARDSLAASLRSDPELLPQLASALVAMAEWFELAGDSAMAGMAAGTAATLEEESETHPLLVQMAGVGLRVAMINLARGLGLPD